MRRKNKIIDGQLEFDFIYLKENFDQEEIDRKLKSKCIKKYRRKTIKSGTLIEIEFFPIWDTKVINRGKKENSSSDKQQKLNDKNRRKHIIRLVHANFKEGDLWITVGYAKGKEPKDDERAYKNIKNYMDSLRRLAKKQGIEFKYIYVTEKSSTGRYHHHIICNLQERDMVEKKWKHGKYPNARRITTDDGSMEGLANYICKEIKDKKNQKRYSTSKNLVQPKITIADTVTSKRKIEKMAKSEHEMIAYAKKEHPKADFISSSVLFSGYCDGAYVYLKMIKKE